MLWKIVFVLTALTVHLSCAACETLFTFADPRVRFRRARLLGEGENFETKVWLRFREEFVAEKEFGPGSVVDNDLAAWVVQRWLIANAGPMRLRPPEYVVPIPARPMEGRPFRGYRLPYVPGRTVKDLVTDERVPSEIRDRVNVAYREILSRTIAFLAPRLPTGDAVTWPFDRDFEWALIGLPPAWFPEVKTSESKIEITIKPDNIIVDPWTLEMTLIDPY